MAEATELVLTLLAWSKSSLLTNIPSSCSIIIMELNDTDFVGSTKKRFSKTYTKFRHCKISSSFVVFSGCFEDPNGHLWMRERTKHLQLLFQSLPDHSHHLQLGDLGRYIGHHPCESPCSPATVGLKTSKINGQIVASTLFLLGQGSIHLSPDLFQRCHNTCPLTKPPLTSL